MNASTIKKCSAAVVLGLMALLPGYLTLTTSDAGIKLIADFEGCQLTPYQCSAGIWTSGIGHTAGVIPQGHITDQKAAENLLADIKTVEKGLKNCMSVEMPQAVYDSVVAFTFNVGVRASCHSTLAFFINKRQWRDACEQLPRWVFVKGVRSAGLERRRAAERTLCLSSL
ncbi:phage lysis protein [Enterobacterales bacterium]|nr:phage lysis protein [Enterobacterales bacterium]